jgi:glycosyltransferase involved in cell wall biosynthesis
LFPDSYLKRIYDRRGRDRQLRRLLPQIVRWQARRWNVLARQVQQYDVVFLQYEAMPYAPAFFERTLFRHNPRVVVDYDDATHVTYEQHSNPILRRILGSKIARIVAESRHVVAGNRYIAEWAGQYNPNTTIIPTSVDLNRYPANVSTESDNGKPIIGWIGTPVTARYLRMLEEPLRALRARHDFVLKVIGAPDFSMDGIDVVNVPWSETTEVEELQRCDVGVMPVPDDPWARGKSALKLIQYLAAGVAAVASPVGANCDVIEQGQNGLLARTDNDWIEQLSLVMEQPDRRRRMAHAGRKTVEAEFSLQANAPRLGDVLRQVALTPIQDQRERPDDPRELPSCAAS